MDNKTLTPYVDFCWERFIEYYPALVKFDPPKMVLCNRLTRTAGKTYQEVRKIHLANKFFARNRVEMLKIILPHELAHQVDFDLFGESEKKCGHGKKWQEIMVKFGIPANKYHSLVI